MGNIPRSTRALEISMTNCDSCPTSAARSTSILTTGARISPNSADRSRLSKGCRMFACSSTSIASCTSRSVSYRQRRIWHSSNIWLRLMRCLDLELEACIQARKSCWAASSWTRLTSCSTRTVPRAHSKVAYPSSHSAMAPSLLSNSTTSADVATTFEGEEALHESTSGDHYHDKKQA
jgi:hypothetical protein